MIVRNPYCTNTWFITPSLLKSVDITGMQDSGESDKTKNHSFIAGTKANKKQKQNYNRAQNKPADWLQTDKKPSLTDEQTDTALTMRANMTTNSRRRIQHIHKRVIKGSGDTWRHSWTESLLTSQIKQNLTWDTHTHVLRLRPRREFDIGTWDKQTWWQDRNMGRNTKRGTRL